jgi:hypothetical protein
VDLHVPVLVAGRRSKQTTIGGYWDFTGGGDGGVCDGSDKSTPPLVTLQQGNSPMEACAQLYPSVTLSVDTASVQSTA